MDPFELYGLKICGRTVKTPIALASMAGFTDAEYVLKRKDNCGIAFIGGYSIDEQSLAASKVMSDNGRDEFLFDTVEDAFAGIKSELEKLKETDVIPGINLRGTEPASFLRAFQELGDGVIYEIDAHCRQKPMTDAGCGEYYLAHPDKLAEVIKVLKVAGAVVSVKIRAGVNSNDALLACIIADAGADIIHVDLMDFGYAKVKEIRNACGALIIANNSINTFETMKDMLSHGADMVSLARSASVPVLSGLSSGINTQAEETGWYNSPKQLCRGGDIRSLCFCCMPVKQCPLIPWLSRFGVSPKEYFEIKSESYKGTPLDTGDSTCFNSIAWCCKASTPCMFRDMALKHAKLSHPEYMRQKRILAGKIVDRIFSLRKNNKSTKPENDSTE